MSDRLNSFLQMAVPLDMQKLEHLDQDELHVVAKLAGRVVAEKGDVIQFRANGTARATKFLVRGLAAAALLAEGGITFNGLHFCRDHAACEAAS